MAGKSTVERLAFWRELIERRQAGNLNVKQLCQQAGVSASAFYEWQRRLREARELPDLPPPQNELVPVRLVREQRLETSGLIEIELPQPICLRVPSPCDPVTLRLVWDLLRAGRPGGRGGCC